MVHYKLTYFNGRGLGECARQIFALADQKYEDVRVTHETFPALKPKLPFGQVPLLEEDGKALAQSNAVNRYLARKFGYAGKTPFEEALVDSLADQFTDYRLEIKPYSMVAFGFQKGDLEKLKKELVLPARDKFFGFIVKFLKSNKSGFLVGDSVTWVDLLLAEHSSDMSQRIPDFLNGFPEVKAHMEKVRSIPKLKKWIETRPASNF